VEASIPHSIVTPAGTLTFNSALTLGQYALDTVESDMPNIRQDVNPLSGREGGIVQPAWNDPLYPVFSGFVIPTTAPVGTSKVTMDDTLKSYLYSIQRADGTWKWTPSGATERQRVCRLHIAPSIPEGAGADPFQFTLACADPLAYNSTQTTSSNITFNGAHVSVTNNGNVPTYPVVRMYGAIQAPVVTNQLTSEVFTFGSGLTIADGAYVDFDMRLGSAKLSTDGSSVLSKLTIAGSTLWPLYAGAQYILATGTSPGANAKVQIIYRDAWA
jgi:hypothetical protein